VTHEFGRRRLGIACQAIRDDELKAEAMGLHVTRCKTAAWMISAALTGLVGGIYAYWMSYIDPPGVFDMAIAVKSFVIVLLGGAGTVLGPVAGAFAIELLATFTWSKLLNWHLGALGVIIVLTVMLFPDGLREASRRRKTGR
jgi:branched-chain amino acid transport system permease protein